MNVSIYGIGYVGCALAAVSAEKGHTISMVDINEEKVELINKGISPIREAGVRERLESYAQQTISASTTINVLGDLVFICVGTPSNNDGSVNTSAIHNVGIDIARILQSQATKPIIVLRSTSPPGTTSDLNQIIQEVSGKIEGEDYFICMNPEFLREGTSIQDLLHGDITVIGVKDSSAKAKLSEYYRTLGITNIDFMSIEEAELFKYIMNGWHALKVGFANEVGRLAKAHNLSAYEMMKVFCKDTQLNISSYYLRPGFSYGGSCLPKDVRALGSFAKQKNISLPLFEVLPRTNQDHIHFAVDKIKKEKPVSVLISGISFKPNTNDFRESPYVKLLKQLVFEMPVFFIDPAFDEEYLLGVNKYEAETLRKYKATKQDIQNASHVIVGSHVPDPAIIKGKVVIDLNSECPDNYQVNFKRLT